MSKVKRRIRRIEKRWVRKRDGRLEAYNRSKIRSSVLQAGATRKQARDVTNTITTRVRSCKLCKEINGKKETSSALLSNTIISELQKINWNAAERFSNYKTRKPPNAEVLSMTPTQSRKHELITNESKRRVFTNRVNALFTEISSISQQTSNITHRIERFNDQIHSLPTRITRIRQGNYRILTHLETDQASLSEIWSKLSRDLRATASQKGEIVHARTKDLQRALVQTQQGSDYDLGNLQPIESRLPELRLTLSEIQGYITSSLTPLEKTYQNIDNDLQMAENTVTLVSQASFPWLEGETPIIATKAKDLNNDLDSVITLTNLRFILEHEKEIVLKKRFFIVTEKKIVREVTVQKPIGMVTRLTKGKVGLLKGSGIFVEFTPESGISEMKFDTKGQEADWMVQKYNDVISGQVDEELAATTPASTPDQETPQLVVCHICGAPYKETIYRGQTSVNCQYCGAAITFQ